MPRVLLIRLEHLAFLAGRIARLHGDGLRRFLVGDLDLVAPADLGEQQPEAHAALGDAAILRPQFVVALRRVARIEPIGGLVGSIWRRIWPNSASTMRGGNSKLVRFVELVEQSALRLRARLLGVIAFDALPEGILHRRDAVQAELLRPRVVGRALASARELA